MVSFAQPLFLYLHYSLYLCIITLFLCISMFVSLSIFLLSISLSLLLSFYLQLSLIICISFIKDTMKNEVLEGRGEPELSGACIHLGVRRARPGARVIMVGSI